VVSEVAERVRQSWQDRGYFKVQASADAHLLTSSPVKGQIAVAVHIEEGQRYRLEEIRFRNNRAITNVEALRSLFAINDGDVFDRAAIAKGLENLRFTYGELGYVNFTSVPDTRFNEEQQTISLDLDMDEGKQFYVSGISLLGLDNHLLEDSPLQRGNIYNQRLAGLFIQEHAPSSLADASPDSRIHLQLDERAGMLTITFDFRDCPDQAQQ
jgi:outer membrane protein insertion porin family